MKIIKDELRLYPKIEAVDGCYPEELRGKLFTVKSYSGGYYVTKDGLQKWTFPDEIYGIIWKGIEAAEKPSLPAMESGKAMYAERRNIALSRVKAEDLVSLKVAFTLDEIFKLAIRGLI